MMIRNILRRFFSTQDEKFYHDRALSHFEEKNLEEAINDYTQAIKLNPDNPMYYNNRAVMHYEQQKNYAEAIKDYTKAIKLSPNNADYYNNRASAYLAQEKLAEAIQDYTQAIRLSPNNETHYANRAFAYKMQRNYVEASKDYTKAFKLSSGDTWYEAQISACNKARAINVQATFYYYKCAADESFGREAQELPLDIAFNLCPDDAFRSFNLGLNSHRKAALAFNASYQLLEMALYFQTQKNFNRAQQYYTKAEALLNKAKNNLVHGTQHYAHALTINRHALDWFPEELQKQILTDIMLRIDQPQYSDLKNNQKHLTFLATMAAKMQHADTQLIIFYTALASENNVQLTPPFTPVQVTENSNLATPLDDRYLQLPQREKEKQAKQVAEQLNDRSCDVSTKQEEAKPKRLVQRTRRTTYGNQSLKNLSLTTATVVVTEKPIQSDVVAPETTEKALENKDVAKKLSLLSQLPSVPTTELPKKPSSIISSFFSMTSKRNSQVSQQKFNAADENKAEKRKVLAN